MADARGIARQSVRVRARSRREGTLGVKVCSSFLAPAWINAERKTMDFGKPIQTKRGVLKSTQDALHFIERELPAELSDLSRWTFARDLLIEAERTEKKRDLKCAYRQLRQALSS